MIKFTWKLTSEEQTIAQKVIQRNGFYAHPECILKSMLTDDDQTLREKAVFKILQLRAENDSKRGKDEEEGEAEEKEEVGEEEEVEEEEVEEEEVEEEEGEEEEGEDEGSRNTFETMLSLDPFETQALERTKV